jgi:hypothetical protein
MELVSQLKVASPFVAGQFLPGGMTGLEPAAIALEKGSPIAKAMLDEYASMAFDTKMTAGEILANVLERNNLYLYVTEKEVFSPVDVEGKLHITNQTVGIHRCAMSWASPSRKIARWMSWHGMRGLVDVLLRIRRAFR